MASWFATLCLCVFALGLCWASQKKGYAMSFKNFKCDDFEALEQFGQMNWWYDWRTRPFSAIGEKKQLNCSGTDLSQYDAKHYAMIWGYNPPLKEPLSSATAILGFNEPNHAKQANMTPSEAAEHWPEIEVIAGDRPIASPAAAGMGKKEGDTDMFVWFEQFFGNCTEMYGVHGCKVDYIATHKYTCNPNWTTGELRQLHERWGRKIWLTEFACFDTNATVVLNFMKATLPKLETRDWIEKYSWFSSRIKEDGAFVKTTASLLKPDSSELTELGEYYAKYVYNPEA